MYPYRVFVSYAHEDEEIAKRVCEILDARGLNATSDQRLRTGHQFIGEIMDLIDRAHLFVPILTERSTENLWVHEEIGYAIGSGIPVLPLAINVVPGQMLILHQAAKACEDLGDLERALNVDEIHDLVSEAGTNSRAALECADDPETRTKLLADYARLAEKLGGPCRVRQRGALSSFCLPNEHPSRKVWKDRDYPRPRSDHYHGLQWNERKTLEKHALTAGCDLFIDPAMPFVKGADKARRTRLQTLRKFLEDMPDDKVRVATGDAARGGNLTIVGDWFFGESMSPRKGVGYLQTIFSWHAPRVLHEIEEFDEMFKDYYDPKGSSRERAIAEITRIIDTIQV